MENQIQTNSDVKKTFFDEDGELSFYVKNVSDGEVMLSDLGVSIPMLGAKDLREVHDIERLKKSPGLREALSPKANWLKRIQKDEYDRLTELQIKRDNRVEENKKQLKLQAEGKALTNMEGKLNEIKVQISPKVQSMVEKLRLHYKGQVSPITQDDFLVFVESTKLNDDERSYILGVVKEPLIRDAVNKQMQDEVDKK